MTKSKENDQGRYFEYLVSKKIQNKYKVSLTKRAQKDQSRDCRKKVASKKIRSMELASEKICNWLSENLDLDEDSTLDRLPDREFDKQTHEDISIVDKNNKTLSFSLKHNHDAIFHGRVTAVASNNWLNIDKEKNQNIINTFEKNKQNLIMNLQKTIPIGTVFAGARFDETQRKGVKKIYWQVWKEFIRDLHNEVKSFLIKGTNYNEGAVRNLFQKIVGNGDYQYRVLKKGNRIHIQTINDLKLPDKVKIKNIQIPNDKNPCNFYVWHLVFEFNNGMIIDARNKQDDIIMKSKGPAVKSDWKVTCWGESGMHEQII